VIFRRYPEDPSVVKRRARVSKDQMAPGDLSAALAGVRSSKVLHFDSMVGGGPG